MDEQLCRELIRAALEARQRAYAPYSHYLVGTALLCADGTVFTGCNIENASYGATICAERTALFAAVAQGHRRFTALALVSGPEGTGDTEIYRAGGESFAAEEPADVESGSVRMRPHTEEALLPWPSPCGICRQALREFVSPADFGIILARSEREYRVLTLEQLLPESFGPDYL